MASPMLQGGSNIQTNLLNTELLKIQTQQKCDKIINLAKNENLHKGNEEDASDENGFKTINRHRRHHVSRGDRDNKLRGNKISEKKWLFVTRVPARIAVENIQKYLQNRTD